MPIGPIERANIGTLFNTGSNIQRPRIPIEQIIEAYSYNPLAQVISEGANLASTAIQRSLEKKRKKSEEEKTREELTQFAKSMGVPGADFAIATDINTQKSKYRPVGMFASMPVDYLKKYVDDYLSEQSDMRKLSAMNQAKLEQVQKVQAAKQPKASPEDQLMNEEETALFFKDLGYSDEEIKTFPKRITYRSAKLYKGKTKSLFDFPIEEETPAATKKDVVSSLLKGGKNFIKRFISNKENNAVNALAEKQGF